MSPARRNSLVVWCPSEACDGNHLKRVLQQGEEIAKSLSLSDGVVSDCDQRLSVRTLRRSALPEASNQRTAAEASRTRISLLDHKVILTATCEHGALEWVPTLLAEQRATPAGALIGIGDATILHALWQLRRWGQTIYGVPPGLPLGPRSAASTTALLGGASLITRSDNAPDVAVLCSGTVAGPCFAADLRVLAGLCGTTAMPRLVRRIVVIDLANVTLSDLNRWLLQLHQSGALDQIAGLVFGELSGVWTTDDQSLFYKVLRKLGEQLGVPTIAGLPIGRASDPISIACGRYSQLIAYHNDWYFLQDQGPIEQRCEREEPTLIQTDIDRGYFPRICADVGHCLGIASVEDIIAPSGWISGGIAIKLKEDVSVAVVNAIANALFTSYEGGHYFFSSSAVAGQNIWNIPEMIPPYLRVDAEYRELEIVREMGDTYMGSYEEREYWVQWLFWTWMHKFPVSGVIAGLYSQRMCGKHFPVSVRIVQGNAPAILEIIDNFAQVVLRAKDHAVVQKIIEKIPAGPLRTQVAAAF